MALSIGHGRKTIVTSGRFGPLQIALCLTVLTTFVIGTIIGLRGSGDKIPFIGLGAMTALAAFVFALSFLRRWTIDIDAKAKRLRIVRELSGRWRKTIVDCSFDECEAIGVLKLSKRSFACSVYVQLKGGKRHDISVAQSSPEEAARISDELANATGIPRVDISA